MTEISDGRSPDDRDRGRGSFAGYSSRVVIAATVLLATIALSHAWNTWRRAAFTAEPFLQGDAVRYVAMMRTGDPNAVPAPFRYRMVTPFLARHAPAPPLWLLADPRELSEDQIAVIRFALVNAAGLTVAAVFLFMLLNQFGFSPWERLAGSLLFMVNHYSTGGAMDPMVDAWGFGLLACGLWGLLTRRWILLAVAFAVGIFNKETIALLPIAALLLRRWSPRERWALAACFVPAVVLYAGVRFVAFPAGQILNPLDWYPAWAARLLASREILAIPKELFASFGILWIPAAIGWMRVERGSELDRLRPLVPLVLLAPLVMIKAPAHSWIYMFPVLIPLALLGLRSLLENWGIGGQPYPAREDGGPG